MLAKLLTLNILTIKYDFFLFCKLQTIFLLKPTLGPVSWGLLQRDFTRVKEVFYCSIRIWDYKLLYTPTFVTKCLHKPRLFFRQAVEMFHLCFCLGAVAGFVRPGQPVWRKLSPFSDLSRRGREKTCPLSTSHFST